MLNRVFLSNFIQQKKGTSFHRSCTMLRIRVSSGTPHTDDVTDYISENNHFYPAVFYNKYTVIFNSTVYTVGVTPLADMLSKFRQNGCADIMHSRNMNYVFCICKYVNVFIHRTHGNANFFTDLT